MCSASASACRSAQRSLQRAQRAQQQSDIVPLLQDAFTFWLKYGPDKQYGKHNCCHGMGPSTALLRLDMQQLRGTADPPSLAPAFSGGFHGTLDRQGNPMNPTNKMIVQQVGTVRTPHAVACRSNQQLQLPTQHATSPARLRRTATATQHTTSSVMSPCVLLLQSRHLWAFSSLLMAKPETWGFKSSEVRAAADTAYKFMRDNMLRDVDGGESDRPGFLLVCALRSCWWIEKLTGPDSLQQSAAVCNTPPS
jgi:hypothetical protein